MTEKPIPQRERTKEATVRSVRVFDASGRVLGRLATDVARALRGKDDPRWVPYRDTGATVIVMNTDRVQVTGDKLRSKRYVRHTQRKPGAFRVLTLGQRLQADSREVIRDAIWNMLPRNRLRRRMMKHLQLFRGEAAASRRARSG